MTRTVTHAEVNMRIFIDMDGVIADFQGEVDRHCKENGLTKLHRPEMKVDFSNMKPMPGAVAAIRKLEADGHDLFIATTPPWDRPEAWGHKRDWIMEHFPSLKKKMFLTHRKDLLDGDVLIDDTRYRGQPDFKGTWIWFGVDSKYPGWPEVLNYINQKFDHEEV